MMKQVKPILMEKVVLKNSHTANKNTNAEMGIYDAKPTTICKPFHVTITIITIVRNTEIKNTSTGTPSLSFGLSLDKNHVYNFSV